MEVLLELYCPDYNVESDAVSTADHLRSSSLKCYLYELTHLPRYEVPQFQDSYNPEPTRMVCPSKVKVQLIGGEQEVIRGLNYIQGKFKQDRTQISFLRIGDTPS